MNFLKPQSFPCTKRYALWLSASSGGPQKTKNTSSLGVRKKKKKTSAGILLTHGFGLLALGVEDGELELGSDLGLWTADQQQVEGQVVFALLVQAFGVHTQTPEAEGGEVALTSRKKKKAPCALM